jgi:hypothetical protein
MTGRKRCCVRPPFRRKRHSAPKRKRRPRQFPLPEKIIVAKTEETTVSSSDYSNCPTTVVQTGESSSSDTVHNFDDPMEPQSQSDYCGSNCEVCRQEESNMSEIEYLRQQNKILQDFHQDVSSILKDNYSNDRRDDTKSNIRGWAHQVKYSLNIISRQFMADQKN